MKTTIKKLGPKESNNERKMFNRSENKVLAHRWTWAGNQGWFVLFNLSLDVPNSLNLSMTYLGHSCFKLKSMEFSSDG